MMRTKVLEAGQAVQCLYVELFDSMGVSVSAMRALAEFEGWEFLGKHHDLYLSEP